jgi:hypothetical protein
VNRPAGREEKAVGWWLVHVLAPLGVATYFAVAFRRGGGWRLWRDAAILTLPLVWFAIWQRDVYLYDEGPMNAEGVETWAFPPAVLIAAAVVHVLSRLSAPAIFTVALAALLASLAMLPFHWMS